jgi:hypothetical protein
MEYPRLLPLARDGRRFRVRARRVTYNRRQRRPYTRVFRKELAWVSSFERIPIKTIKSKPRRVRQYLYRELPYLFRVLGNYPREYSRLLTIVFLLVDILNAHLWKNKRNLIGEIPSIAYRFSHPSHLLMYGVNNHISVYR